MNLLMNNVVIIYMDYFRSLLTNSKKTVSATAPYTTASRINKNLDDINNWIYRIKKKQMNYKDKHISYRQKPTRHKPKY